MTEHDQLTVQLYDADDVSQFFRIVVSGDGDCFHSGIYERPDMTSHEASCNTVRVMRRLAQSAGATFDAATRVLDEGSGGGGPAHIIARETGAHVTCLNLCEGQNAQNERRVAELQLQDRIDVVLGNFEQLPAEWTQTFDVVYSQDAYVHSNDKRRVLEEAFRALKPGGFLVLSDLMASALASESDLKLIKGRLHLQQMFTVDDYEREMAAVGFEVLRTRDFTSQLVPNYRRMYKRLESERSRLDMCSDEFIESYRANLKNTIELMKERDAQAWFIFIARKPEHGKMTNGIHGA